LRPGGLLCPPPPPPPPPQLASTTASAQSGGRGAGGWGESDRDHTNKEILGKGGGAVYNNIVLFQSISIIPFILFFQW
jgi:hypothetical protein